MFLKQTLTFSNLTLLVALTLSTVAAYYSIIGLTAIFAGAVVPIIIMGSVLEIGKIVTTVWLRKYWYRCGWLLKIYLVPAVVLLALLTSMGIFGFLSKAHMDQGIISGDSQAKLALYDEKIKTQRDNIELARKALQQMDAQVDARLSRGDSEQGAERAVQIRRQQQSERAKLQKEIGDAQQEITRLNEERAPIAAETRKIEAEVGPVKYIAALIYGDDADQNMLERAVRWVIILLVIVFDPLAIALVLAANASKDWDKEVSVPQEDSNILDSELEPKKDIVEEYNNISSNEPTIEKPWYEKYPYLLKPFVHFSNLKPLVYKPEKSFDPEDGAELKNQEQIFVDTDIVKNNQKTIKSLQNKDIITEGVTKEIPLIDLKDGYVTYEGKHYSKQALKELKPELFMARADNEPRSNTNFGTEFPKVANKGDIFVRVDVLPNRVYKFSDKRWIEINKNNTDSYLFDQEYVKYLVNKISTGEYDIEILTESEKAQIEEYLKNQNS